MVDRAATYGDPADILSYDDGQAILLADRGNGFHTMLLIWVCLEKHGGESGLPLFVRTVVIARLEICNVGRLNCGGRVSATGEQQASPRGAHLTRRRDALLRCR